MEPTDEDSNGACGGFIQNCAIPFYHSFCFFDCSNRCYPHMAYIPPSKEGGPIKFIRLDFQVNESDRTLRATQVMEKDEETHENAMDPLHSIVWQRILWRVRVITREPLLFPAGCRTLP
ncbi:hypothetical protein SAMN05444955_108225 [Lihuaxuella thermophila]|uniref:Uncharacterized protein n=1 Tax=Lihuaxuella thermophila TaxID=1173111 RepID=A0A1H8FJT8_9BACL|nr:hypothetical protein SAMN05444955_108225 [Lihuaxuella thermophila]